jgi:hypothetical protein
MVIAPLIIILSSFANSTVDRPVVEGGLESRDSRVPPRLCKRVYLLCFWTVFWLGFVHLVQTQGPKRDNRSEGGNFRPSTLKWASGYKMGMIWGRTVPPSGTVVAEWARASASSKPILDLH